MRGVSVIVRSSDSASRLLTALAYLKVQAPTNIPWEVLVVDKTSTGDAVKDALWCWGEGPVPLRIVPEPKLGRQSATERGLKEARHEFIGFVDDDNWVAPDWVQVAYDTLASDRFVGAVGSVCDPVFETPEPKWFSEFHSIYGVLTHSDLNERKDPWEYLHGAGLCIRKQAWTRLVQGGFRSLADRIGVRSLGSRDMELTLAIRLTGWKISVERRLRVKHFIPAERLCWDYLRRLQRSCAASQALLDAYSAHNLSMRYRLKPRLGQLWWCQAGRSLLKLMGRPSAVALALTSKGEDQADVMEVEKLFGRILGMVYLRRRYRGSRRHVRYAPWRLRRPEEYMRRLRQAHP
ncbi:MAG TPA: glycosyltransferase [Candidatus Sulfotelmatobacter sp.]|nr:glycosyltransferase [Candidatus Sulfotelmatobacter sp.]